MNNEKFTLRDIPFVGDIIKQREHKENIKKLKENAAVLIREKELKTGIKEDLKESSEKGLAERNARIKEVKDEIERIQNKEQTKNTA